MGKTKFIDNIKDLFGIESDEEKKKKAVKELISKLVLRRKKLKEELHQTTDVIKREALKDSIKIVKRQIKKGKELLD